jgi:hypothetical protein
MKYGYKEVRHLGASQLRALCIKEDWYTGGTVNEYGNLLDMAERENITTDDIVEMATDIYEHSEEAMNRLKRAAGYDMSDCLKHIMFAIAERCTTCFEEA